MRVATRNRAGGVTMSRLSVVAAAACALAFASACTVDEDCSLNGVCNASGQCECDPGWVGNDCGALNFAPATYGTGYNQTLKGTSSWGGRAVRDPSNSSLFHLFAAEFTGGCGLDYWSPFSRIIRATGSSPEGPFVLSAEVVGTFAHNPVVIYSPADKLYLMYHIGCAYSVPSTCQMPSFSCDAGNNLNGESSISYLTSTDLVSWTAQGVALGPNVNGTWDTDTTNPSAFPFASASDPTNTSMLLVYRGCPWNCGGDELISLSYAPSYGQPFDRSYGGDVPIFPNGTEDPHVWRDARGHWHMLLHSLEADGAFGNGPKVGRHAYARDVRGPWTFNSNTLAFNTTVQFTDGSSVNYYRRERPQLFFSDDGQMTPLYLYTGVQEVNSPQSYTLVQPLATARTWEAANGIARPQVVATGEHVS